jgi:hypothetical protein
VWILDPLDFALMDGVVDINDEANAAVQSLVQWIGADPGSYGTGKCTMAPWASPGRYSGPNKPPPLPG